MMKTFTNRGYILRLICVSIVSILIFECIQFYYDSYKAMKEAEEQNARMAEMQEVAQSIIHGFVDQDFETLTKYLGVSEEEDPNQVLAGYRGLSLQYLSDREEPHGDQSVYRILYQVDFPLPEAFRQEVLKQGAEDLLAFIEETHCFVLTFMLSYIDGQWSYTKPLIIRSLNVAT